MQVRHHLRHSRGPTHLHGQETRCRGSGGLERRTRQGRTAHAVEGGLPSRPRARGRYRAEDSPPHSRTGLRGWLLSGHWTRTSSRRGTCAHSGATSTDAGCVRLFRSRWEQGALSWTTSRQRGGSNTLRALGSGGAARSTGRMEGHARGVARRRPSARQEGSRMVKQVSPQQRQFLLQSRSRLQSRITRGGGVIQRKHCKAQRAHQRRPRGLPQRRSRRAARLELRGRLAVARMRREGPGDGRRRRRHRALLRQRPVEGAAARRRRPRGRRRRRHPPQPLTLLVVQMTAHPVPRPLDALLARGVRLWTEKCVRRASPTFAAFGG